MADDDLDEIWAYIDADNPAAAESQMRSLTSKFELLANHEGLGTTRPHIDDGIRVFPVGRYLILFRRMENGIEVVRVVHGARNLTTLKLQ
mgnify:CR=1 FL=1